MAMARQMSRDVVATVDFFPAVFVPRHVRHPFCGAFDAGWLRGCRRMIYEEIVRLARQRGHNSARPSVHYEILHSYTHTPIHMCTLLTLQRYAINKPLHTNAHNNQATMYANRHISLVPRPSQMLAACRTSPTSRRCRRSRSAHWKSTVVASIPTSQRASANCCCGYPPCERCPHRYDQITGIVS